MIKQPVCNEAYRLLAFYKLNPEDFIIKAGKIINNQKADMIIEHITYNKLEESYSADIFMLANLHGRQGVNAMPADRSLYNYVIYDSDNERRFAHELDVCDKIAVYVKLPGSFFISTPVASTTRTGRLPSTRERSSISILLPKPKARPCLTAMSCAALRT